MRKQAATEANLEEKLASSDENKMIEERKEVANATKWSQRYVANPTK